MSVDIHQKGCVFIFIALLSCGSAEHGASCLSGVDNVWCNQNMDEPVGLLQLKTNVHKRGGKLKADQGQSVMPEDTEMPTASTKHASVAVAKDVQALPREIGSQPAEAIHSEAIGFFQVGKAEVNHRTPSKSYKVFDDVSFVGKGFAEVAKSHMQRISSHLSHYHSSNSNLTYVIALSAVALVAVCYMVLTRGWRKLYFRGWERRDKVMVEDEVASTPAPDARRPTLPGSCTSFAVPLAPLRASIEGHRSFDIVGREDGVIVSAALTRLPGIDTWAKIEFSMTEQDEASSSSELFQRVQCLTCTRMESHSDIETRNVEGALDSWLSLLYHDKNSQSNPEMACEEQDSQAEDEQAQVVTKKGNKIAEAVSKGGHRVSPAASPLKSNMQQSQRFEVRDGMGNLSGTIEADAMGHCGFFVKEGGSKLKIDAGHKGRAVAVSQDGQEKAIATGLKCLASSDLEQADSLQVELVVGPRDPEFLHVLMCAIAPVAFNL